MSDLRQHIIHFLIMRGRASAFDVADERDFDPYDVFSELREMQLDGLVALDNWTTLDDCDDDTPEANEMWFRSIREECEPEHFIDWVYCGSPITRAFRDAAEAGRANEQR